MTSMKDTLEALYEDVKSKYDLSEIGNKDDLPSIMDENDYVIYLCHKLQYWLDVNRIYKVCTYYSNLTRFMSSHNLQFSELDDCCQIVITAAKFYVKAVYRVKEVYNL